MKYIGVYFLFSIFYFTNVSAQQNHFLYFQTESKQPFYIRLNEKVLNSSSSGYLIVPELNEGKYKLILGFPKNEWPEQLINYTLEKDAGFLVKNFSEKGWGLFDLQSLKVIMPGNALAVAKSNAEETSKNSFSDMLAAVVNDSTIKQKSIIIKNEDIEKPKEEVTNGKQSVVETKQSNPPGIPVEVLYSVITKNLQVKGKEGLELMYTDEYNDSKDTIRILMPRIRDQQENKNFSATNYADTAKNIQDQAASNPGGVQEVGNIQKDTIITTKTADSLINMQDQAATSPGIVEEDRKMQNDEIITGEDADRVKRMQNQAESNPGIVEEDKKIQNDAMVADNNADTGKNLKDQEASNNAVVVEAEKKDTLQGKAEENKMEFLPAKPGVSNVNCKQYATEDDFFKLRKRMAAENNDDEMIRAAKKIFKVKCFTTKEVKNLSALFLTDEGKYNFFSAAYSYVSDGDIFYTLENQFSDEYFVKRFKAMIR